MTGGGLPRVLASAPSSRGGCWGLNDTILFVPETNSPILQVPASGGEPRAVTTLDVSRGEIGHRWPAFVDNDHFVFTIQSTRSDITGIYLGSLSSSGVSRLTSQYSNSAYVAGWLLHVNNSAIVARAFNVVKGTVEGPIEVGGPIAFASGLGHAVFSVVGDLLTYAPGNGESPTTVVQWVDRVGRTLGRVGDGSDLGNYNAYLPTNVARWPPSRSVGVCWHDRRPLDRGSGPRSSVPIHLRCCDGVESDLGA